MPHPAFQKLVVDTEAAVSEWEAAGGPHGCGAELDFYRNLRSALDTYYAEVAR